MNIVDRFSQGDQAAFSLIWRKFYPVAYSVASSFLGDKAAAEDIVSEIFEKLWRIHQNFAGKNESDVKAFLLVATKNRCIDRYRADKKEHVRKADYKKTIDVQQSFDFIQLRESMRHELISRILTASQRLAPATKKVFDLAFLEGIPDMEISKLLNIQYQVVRNQKSRALAQIRKILADNPEIQQLLPLAATSLLLYPALAAALF
ncbi:MAG: sigma-70 family RNA polymerase sigma factor [Candidatus Pseudobacter hemicellulosilyticus]|uniref:Sigma-70 family RNA polymerase sigma factor n=1 Tax=Candidatus Pseudobacter hemicellulosilyticus TaxID=3121375 RepID=A0AAJ6BGT2_9BACT|nr:MAG: sigma-70 family RNA polymerase sigma factor [Pseudobacter sp.]